MLCIIITLPLLSVLSVDGLEPETGSSSTRAVSTQSYHREDVPLSYSVTSYHDYTTIKPVYAVNNYIPRYESLQPFHSDLNSSPLDEPSLDQPQLDQPPLNPLFKISNKNDLEPRMKTKNTLFSNNIIFPSFVPGHNIVVSPRFRHKSLIVTDLYKNYLEPVKSEKIIVPKYVMKEKLSMLEETQGVKAEPETTHLQSAGFPVIPMENFPANTYDVSKKPHTHNEILFPQLPPPRAPRLHLNIARVYGIAHIPHQAPEPPVNKEMPPSHTQAIIVPQTEAQNQDKTLLFPLKNFQRYPIQVVPITR